MITKAKLCRLSETKKKLKNNFHQPQGSMNHWITRFNKTSTQVKNNKSPTPMFKHLKLWMKSMESQKNMNNLKN